MKRISRILVLATMLSIVFTCYAFADIINVPADYATIQAGINASSNGDVVLVQPGTYVENINYYGKLITVASLYYTTLDTSYISQTIIDGNSIASVVTFGNGEDFTSVLTGFTITNGSAIYGSGINCNSSSPTLDHVTITGNNSDYYGGGILCYYSSPNLENVTITGNSAINGGGGIYCEYSSPSLQNVLITINHTTEQYSSGGGIFCNSSSPSLQDVEITGNSAYNGGGIYCLLSSSPTLNNVTISDNSVVYNGGGVNCYGLNASPILQHVAITGNSAGYYGGGIYCYNYAPPSLDNVTISSNSANSGGGIYCGNNSSPDVINSILWNDLPEEIVIESASVNVSYSDIEGSWTGEGNIDADPLFVDPLNGDYHLSWANFPTPDSSKSPCIDAGDPNSPLDPDGTRADMGAYYFNQNVSVDDPQEISNYMLTNHPNPISSHINDLTVSFSIHKPSSVQIQFFNIKGQLISTLINEDKNIGDYTISHTVNDLSSGIYFTKMSVDGVDKDIKKVVLLR